MNVVSLHDAIESALPKGVSLCESPATGFFLFPTYDGSTGATLQSEWLVLKRTPPESQWVDGHPRIPQRFYGKKFPHPGEGIVLDPDGWVFLTLAVNRDAPTAVLKQVAEAAKVLCEYRAA